MARWWLNLLLLFLKIFLILEKISHISRKVEIKWSYCCCFCVTEFNPLLSVLSTAGVVWLLEGSHGKVDTAGTNSPSVSLTHCQRLFLPLIFSLSTLLVKELWIKKSIFSPNTRITRSQWGGKRWRGTSKCGNYISNADALLTSPLF